MEVEINDFSILLAIWQILCLAMLGFLLYFIYKIYQKIK